MNKKQIHRQAIWEQQAYHLLVIVLCISKLVQIITVMRECLFHLREQI